MFLGRQRFATSPNTPSRSQPPRIPKPNVASSSASTSGSGTTSKIPQGILSPNRSRLTTPSVTRLLSSNLRPMTPSFSQSAETINIFINYDQE